jgi:hypothetical protein
MRYKVWLRSTPGMWERYEGSVEVSAESDQEAEKAALNQLAARAFRGRGRDAWIVEKVERVGDPYL